ncbi:MAG: fibronectin type III domain-containing protein [Candidatus Tectomicrobia bacterium]|uniref:Fibronectin type III domain-containing protein n=1 Tax=Tectimicrobiota bacterium TaxID=2528274 RepID=A0A932GSC0_UNCTE|nr:fibronectin type III domain-containing protein [Candidatus Tectomicrobia bacterium]
MPPQIPTPTADPQLVAQVQQVRNAWQQLNAQVSQTPNLQPEDRAALAQDMQRGSQALDAAEAAAKHGDRGTTQKQLGQVQQALASASQRLSEIARRPAPAPQQPPRAGPASPPPAPAPSPTPDPQLFAQVQQLRTAWQQINTQVTQMPNLQPQDRASLIQDLQRGSQAIDGAEAAARRGDRATVQAQLAHAQQVLGAVSQRLSQIVQRAAAPQQTPRASPPSAPPPQATLSPPGPFSLSATTRCSAAQPEVVLSWNASPGAKAYALLRNGQLYRDFTYVGTSLAFVNQGVVGGTRYTYVVRAKNDAGQTRDSNPVTAAPPTCRR